VTDQHQGQCVICAERPVWADRLICTACYGGLRDDLTVCAGAYAWLGECMLALPPSWRTSTIRSNEVEAAAPMPLGLVDARARIADTLLFWVRAAMEIRAGRGGPPTPTVAGCTWWLRRQLHWIVRNRAVETLARDLHDLRRDAQRSAPWDRVRRDLPTRCPRCWRLSLTWYQGDDWITCRSDDCGRLLSFPRVRRAVNDWARLRLEHFAKETISA